MFGTTRNVDKAAEVSFSFRISSMLQYSVVPPSSVTSQLAHGIQLTPKIIILALKIDAVRTE
jgi:hypothetical protein